MSINFQIKSLLGPYTFSACPSAVWSPLRWSSLVCVTLILLVARHVLARCCTFSTRGTYESDLRLLSPPPPLSPPTLPSHPVNQPVLYRAEGGAWSRGGGRLLHIPMLCVCVIKDVIINNNHKKTPIDSCVILG